MNAVLATKYVALASPFASIVLYIGGLLQSETKNNKLIAAVKGWAMSPVHKSVNANTLRRIWKIVLWKVFLQIAAKISEFPATATGDKMAIMMEHENVVA